MQRYSWPGEQSGFPGSVGQLPQLLPGSSGALQVIDPAWPTDHETAISTWRDSGGAWRSRSGRFGPTCRALALGRSRPWVEMAAGRPGASGRGRPDARGSWVRERGWPRGVWRARCAPAATAGGRRRQHEPTRRIGRQSSLLGGDYPFLSPDGGLASVAGPAPLLKILRHFLKFSEKNRHGGRP
jgi:hypothetical protein